MSKDINLTSSEWTDIVFEGRNKEYGAYVMRQNTTKRHILALLVTVSLLVFVIFLPSLIKTIIPEKYQPHYDDSTIITDVDLTKNIPQPVVPIEKPKPIKVRKTVAYTPPEITEEKIQEKDKMKAQVDLMEEKGVIANITQEGSTDPDATIIDEPVQEITQTETNEVLIGVEQMPKFPGGDKALMSYISKNIHYPTISAENGSQGKVILRFVVSKTGAVTNVQILKGFDPNCDKEAVRVIQSMPKWIPGKQNGRNVNVYYTLPVVFRLQ